MRAWITKGAIRLIAETDLEASMLRSTVNKNFRSMSYVCSPSSYKGDHKGIAELYLDEVKETVSSP